MNKGNAEMILRTKKSQMVRYVVRTGFIAVKKIIKNDEEKKKSEELNQAG